MDGPLLMRLEKVDEKVINLKGIKRNSNEKVLFEAQTNFNDFKKSLVTVSNAAISYVDLKGWKNYELLNLKRHLNSL
ncbi:hypothetical protein ACFSCX_19340 [Bacillus salitolerans]|uniref:STAS domain-containing protein n=1 Tax=Bacillus salitolerans TaxID=1437434 RepID=A0ABW4LU79_9BACI